MSWSKDKLRALAVERGETVAGIGGVLLAHERMRGRTEEDYPRDVAGKELDALLERQSSPLPLECTREYAGLKQLRAYASDRALQRAASQSAEKVKAEPVQGQAASNVERSYQQREPEQEPD